MTRDEALVLLRSGQMPVSRYVQLCDENGWEQFGLGTHLLAEAGNALDDKDAEIASLRADLQVLRGVAAAVGDQNWSQGKIIFEAADEIERLRTELKYRVHCDADIEVQNKHIVKLEATIADLTAALVYIERDCQMMIGKTSGHSDAWQYVGSKARAALARAQGGTK